MILKLTLPVEIMIPRKTSRGVNYIVNLNNYGNRFNRADAKLMYEEAVRREYVRVCEGVRLEEFYVIFIHHPSNNNIDTANVLSVVEKFTCDGLQDVKDKKNKKRIIEQRLIPNDSRREIKGHFYFPGTLSPKNPYAEMLIIDNQKEFIEQISACYAGVHNQISFNAMPETLFPK